MEKQLTILIVDDMEINRELLSVCFEDKYNILCASDGKEAMNIIKSDSDVSAVLLDMLMPEMNGLEVLAEMRNMGIVQKIPVFVITAADSEKMLMEAYNLGAVDVVNKPFMSQFLKCRVDNTIELYRHRNHLEEIVSEQVAKIKAINQSMVETLATLIEFRDCESGAHVKRMCRYTDILIRGMGSKYPEYSLSEDDIQNIVSAAVLHDVGKIAIPDSILKKPGRLTDDEFAVMKNHTIDGCDILDRIPHIIDEEVYKFIYDICRHHHERWNGRGYPDGLAGDEITLWSQVVSLADVYDALTTQRCYKPAFTHEVAVKMIMNNECGVFNPKLLDVFRDLDAEMEEIRASLCE